MSYIATDRSVSNGTLIELYQFALGSFSYNYTSSDEDVTVLGVTYKTTQISRTTIKKNQEIASAAITITLPFDSDFAKEYLEAPPSQEATVKVSSYHEEDNSGEVLIDWIGRVATVKFKDETNADLRCETITTTLKRTLLRRNYQRQCPHLLYGAQCGVNRTLFKVEGSGASIAGVTLQMVEIGQQGDGFWTGGFVEFQNPNLPLQRRFITTHVGQFITMDLPISDRPAGTTIIVYAGCARNTETCKNKFNNLDNYGGMPYIPLKNPLNGTSIF
jgi:uncharacterized phage protein (TIGR02218 family)